MNNTLLFPLRRNFFELVYCVCIRIEVKKKPEWNMRYGPILLMYVVHVNTRILILTSATDYILHTHMTEGTLCYIFLYNNFIENKTFLLTVLMTSFLVEF